AWGGLPYVGGHQRDRQVDGLAPGSLFTDNEYLVQNLRQTFRVGLAPGPLSLLICLCSSCRTSAVSGHTAALAPPFALQSHRRPRKTPRSYDLGVSTKRRPSGEGLGNPGWGGALLPGAAPLGCGSPVGSIPSSVGGRRPIPPAPGSHPLPGPGRLRLPRPPLRSGRSTRSARHPPGASLAPLGDTPTPTGSPQGRRRMTGWTPPKPLLFEEDSFRRPHRSDPKPPTSRATTPMHS